MIVYTKHSTNRLDEIYRLNSGERTLTEQNVVLTEAMCRLPEVADDGGNRQSRFIAIHVVALRKNVFPFRRN